MLNDILVTLCMHRSLLRESCCDALRPSSLLSTLGDSHYPVSTFALGVRNSLYAIGYSRKVPLEETLHDHVQSLTQQRLYEDLEVVEVESSSFGASSGYRFSSAMCSA